MKLAWSQGVYAAWRRPPEPRVHMFLLNEFVINMLTFGQENKQNIICRMISCYNILWNSLTN